MSWALLDAARRAHHGVDEKPSVMPAHKEHKADAKRLRMSKRAYHRTLVVLMLSHQEDKNVDASAYDGIYKHSLMPILVAINMRSINKIQSMRL